MPSHADYRLKREEVWKGTLSKYDVRDILLSDKSDEQLARLYKVTTQTIGHIRRHYAPRIA